MFFAPRITAVAVNQTQAQVANDSPVVIYGILVSGDTTTGTVTFLDKDNATLFTLNVRVSHFLKLRVPFKAGNGFRVTTPVGASAVIFHGHPGS